MAHTPDTNRSILFSDTEVEGEEKREAPKRSGTH